MWASAYFSGIEEALLIPTRVSLVFMVSMDNLDTTVGEMGSFIMA
jgi:hypothetical protein